MYRIINETLKAYLITNEGSLEPKTEAQIRAAQCYVLNRLNTASKYEQLEETLDQLNLSKLRSYVQAMNDFNIGYPSDPNLQTIVDELQRIDEALTYEEENYLGLSKTARYHRKRWRKLTHKLERRFKLIIKNHLAYQKEWSKPRQVYTLNATGECHNGLYYTIKELIHNPKLIKSGFRSN